MAGAAEGAAGEQEGLEMPGRNGQGPTGRGPQTGRGRGRCSENLRRGARFDDDGHGRGRGRRMRGRGPGRGFGRGWEAFADHEAAARPADGLKDEIAWTRRRLAELEAMLADEGDAD